MLLCDSHIPFYNKPSYRINTKDELAETDIGCFKIPGLSIYIYNPFRPVKVTNIPPLLLKIESINTALTPEVAFLTKDKTNWIFEIFFSRFCEFYSNFYRSSSWLCFTRPCFGE